MTVKERLDSIAGMIRVRAFDLADKEADRLSEDYIAERVRMSDEQYNYLFILINRISEYFYGC